MANPEETTPAPTEGQRIWLEKIEQLRHFAPILQQRIDALPEDLQLVVWDIVLYDCEPFVRELKAELGLKLALNAQWEDFPPASFGRKILLLRKKKAYVTPAIREDTLAPRSKRKQPF